MATKAAALQAWLEGFGLPVYRDSAVPRKAKMPYITYDLPTAAFGTQCNSEVTFGSIHRPSRAQRQGRGGRPGHSGSPACCCRATAAACG